MIHAEIHPATRSTEYSLAVLDRRAVFILAGTLSIWGFWIYIATATIYQMVNLLIIVPRYPFYIEFARDRKNLKTTTAGKLLIET